MLFRSLFVVFTTVHIYIHTYDTFDQITHVSSPEAIVVDLYFFRSHQPHLTQLTHTHTHTRLDVLSPLHHSTSLARPIGPLWQDNSTPHQQPFFHPPTLTPKMCIIRRGVCPSCATGNLYWDHCAHPSSSSSTTPEQCSQLWPGVQRGGSRSCYDHTGRACSPSPSSPSPSSFSSSSSSSYFSTPNFEHHHHHHQQPQSQPQYQGYQGYQQQLPQQHQQQGGPESDFEAGMEALTWRMAAFTTEERQVAPAATIPRTMMSSSSSRGFGAEAEMEMEAEPAAVSWGAVSW